MDKYLQKKLENLEVFITEYEILRKTYPNIAAKVSFDTFLLYSLSEQQHDTLFEELHGIYKKLNEIKAEAILSKE